MADDSQAQELISVLKEIAGNLSKLSPVAAQEEIGASAEVEVESPANSEKRSKSDKSFIGDVASKVTGASTPEEAAAQMAAAIIQKVADVLGGGAKDVIQAKGIAPWEATKKWADESGQAGIVRTQKEIKDFRDRQIRIGDMKVENNEKADLEGSYMPANVIRWQYRVGDYLNQKIFGRGPQTKGG